MNYIEYKEGKVYDHAHLRPFNLELAKQGHLLADKDGREIRLLREGREGDHVWAYDSWDKRGFWFCERLINVSALDKYLRLAPLDVKDGRPLHYLDHVERFYQQNEYHHVRWDRTQVGDIGFGFWAKNPDKWRWPVEVKV